MHTDFGWFFYSLVTMLGGVWYALRLRGFDWSEIFVYSVSASFAGLICFLPGKHERIYMLSEHVHAYPFMTVGIFVLGVVAFQRERISRPMSEGDLFLLSLSLLYMLLPWRLDHQIIAAVSFIPTLGVVWYAVSKMPLGRRSQLMLGAWTLILTFIFATEQLIPGMGELLARHRKFASFDAYDFVLNALEIMLTVNVFVTLTSAILPFFWLTRGKHESAIDYHARLDNVELPFLRGRILSQQIPLPALALILGVHGLPLLLNWRFHFVSDATAMAYAMVISPLVTFGVANRLFKTPSQTAQQETRHEQQAA